jgi:hypothetical protein
VLKEAYRHRCRRSTLDADGCDELRVNTKTVTDEFFYVVRTVHFGMKWYNDQRNGHVYSLFICLLLPYMFRAFL